jgi:hypothetical protein|tara:strand:- start:386 stop:577 length:192 start_codon:yes stop_codon:yes gene_type:complete
MEYLQENVYVPSETLESVQKVLLPQYEIAKLEIKRKIKNDLIKNIPKNKINIYNIKNERGSEA